MCYTSIPKITSINCKIEQEQEHDVLFSQLGESDKIPDEEQEETEPEDTKSKDSEELNTVDFTRFLKERGLYCDELKLFLPSKKQQIKSKVLFKYVEEESDKIPNTMSQKKREKLIKELEEEEEYNKITEEKQKEKHEIIEKLKILREEIKQKHEILKQEENNIHIITNGFYGSPRGA